ncbi:hypothetical protein [Mycobacteroides abscessus]|uniref:hypothetical protein n=1 Tax=Mycobacteroides abscessus TaxID=36809 RepID=UPI00092B1A95|nr:hypothetical protein [Mycobacteroides abscessus]DAZ90331.1 TPA_asm: helix-turn-helix DNA binding domain [Mycobacterium phage prophiFSQJ01-1]SII41012.1 Uncharacterised protein [Mycobacteroides abscessus subsp. abscessus]SIK14190.1 Uncharacterised protein [Mycobacteroides abscessus subsp. abscessus]SIN25394.1 Uncharacterised protein [Mycobacteroides abscessus subsp. abscessus]SLI51549.1 Uncharacterised protein [Mycobacteroides abscessus subsp. abscessus]
MTTTHVHVYRESREARNKRIAITAIDLLTRIVAGDISDPAAALARFHQERINEHVYWTQPSTMPYDPDQWLTANEMAEIADVEPGTVQKWNHRGYITSSEAHDGTKLYNVGEVNRLLAKRQRRQD